jgi:hypothetical protein
LAAADPEKSLNRVEGRIKVPRIKNPGHTMDGVKAFTVRGLLSDETLEKIYGGNAWCAPSGS